jgi:CPA1 family monovalent cation:H+ antiporter
LTSLFSFFNFKYLKLPKTIGLMLLSLIVSIAAAALTGLGVDFVGTATQTIAKIDFSEAVLNVVLCFLLFAGALHIDLDAFMQERLAIAALSTLGVFISTVVVGIGAWLVFYVFGTSLPFVVCLLFGALISPTDPISVLALLKESKVPKSVEMQVAGEALLNDGVGVVLFLAILAVATGSSAVTPSFIAELVVREVIGGVALGLLTGYCAFLLLRQIDDYPIEILLSIALVVGGYALAAALHVSGPLAMVAAGLLIGNRGRKLAMSDETRKNLDMFWEVVDDVLNATLFVLVGFEALLLTLKGSYVLASLPIIAVVLCARYTSIAVSARIPVLRKSLGGHSVTILTWGGLRGGISLALALALPHEIGRDQLMFFTYVVVAFSIIAQGLSFKPMLRHIGMRQ